MDGIWVGQGTVVSVMGTWKVTALIRSGASTVEVPMTVITKSDGTTSTVAIPGAPTTTTTSFPDGVSLQSFVDPATAGPNPVHATAFGPTARSSPQRGRHRGHARRRRTAPPRDRTVQRGPRRCEHDTRRRQLRRGHRRDRSGRSELRIELAAHDRAAPAG
jgi:hypothetical protein